MSKSKAGPGNTTCALTESDTSNLEIRYASKPRTEEVEISARIAYLHTSSTKPKAGELKSDGDIKLDVSNDRGNQAQSKTDGGQVNRLPLRPE
jgi:hypothetical protein